MMRYVWFWTFWHWSREGRRSGSLLLDPLHGIAGHWDEWFSHEASPVEKREIELAGASAAEQSAFLAWLLTVWAGEALRGDNQLAVRFAVGQLAQLPPFRQWPALAGYHTSYGIGGVPAVILEEESMGSPEDVREIEALLLPPGEGRPVPTVVTEGFQIDRVELEGPRSAAISLLGGTALWGILLRWMVAGRRPYPRWMAGALTAGWGGVAAMLAYVLAGPEPGHALVPLVTGLMLLWGGLVLTATGVAGGVLLQAWRSGRSWRAHLEAGQLRFRMSGGLTVKGGSAGLAFCLNGLLAVFRAFPEPARRSWLWRRIFSRLSSEHSAWAATGAVLPDGKMKPVVLSPKYRACQDHPTVRHLLTPRQQIEPGGAYSPPLVPSRAAAKRRAAGIRLGFAAASSGLRGHPCASVAGVLLKIGDLFSAPQLIFNVLACLLSGAMVAALPDARAILFPPPSPPLVGPASPSPYYVWVSLDTSRGDYFRAVLESDFWINRQVDVKHYGGANASVRAEIPLQRRSAWNERDEEQGTISVERRNRFLTREFLPGERVGIYTISFLNQLEHD